MWFGVGAGVGVGVGVDFSKPESESESESLKFGRLRSPELITIGPGIVKFVSLVFQHCFAYNQYKALWAMNERAQEGCHRVTCTCHVG